MRLEAAAGDVIDDGSWNFQGYAAVFDDISDPRHDMFMGEYRLRIKRGAFRKVLNGDTRFLINHTGMPLARTTAGTLNLWEDTKGLRVEAQIGNYSAGNDLRVALQRGDIDQMSFACFIEEDEWTELDDGTILRDLVAFSAVEDVSPVTFPQWPQTEARIAAGKDGSIIFNGVPYVLATSADTSSSTPEPTEQLGGDATGPAEGAEHEASKGPAVDPRLAAQRRLTVEKARISRALID